MSGRPMEVLVHLDLKGAPPTLHYLDRLLAFLPRLKNTYIGLLIEYEDVFPFRGQRLEHVTCPKHGWTLDKVQGLREIARRWGMAVVPLMQTAGHLEYLLKHHMRKQLRELDDYPQCADTALGPSQEVLDALRQMLDAHPEAAAVHVGGDEVWHLGQGYRARERMQRDPYLTPEILYLKYMAQVVSFVKSVRPGVRVLMWDDVLRRIPVEVLRVEGRPLTCAQVEPVVWNYCKQLAFPQDMWPKYAELFAERGVWGGTAFKGASVPHAKFPALRQHVSNHAAWKGLIEEEASIRSKPRFRGLILTGWQRFDHFAVLCELLPVSVPSLIGCLKVLERGEDPERTLLATGAHLNLNGPLPLDSILLMEDAQFPGMEVYRFMVRFNAWAGQVEDVVNGEAAKTWCTEWNLRTGRVSKLHVESSAQRAKLLIQDGGGIIREMEDSLRTVYEEPVVQEWRECFLKPVIEKLEKFIEFLNTAKFA